MTSPAQVPFEVPAGCQLTVKYSQGGQTSNVVLGGLVITPTEPVTLVTATEWLRAWVQNLAGYIGNTVQCTGGQFRDLRPEYDEVYDLPAPSSAANGSVAGTQLAAGAYVVKWRTINGSRSGKGRSFIPGVSATQINADGRTLTAAALNDIGLGINAYMQNMTVPTLQVRPAVISRKQLVAREITGHSVSSIVGIQRRRMRA